mmetsp:Transcript_14200/g.31013  ORF Transcript_14200/g.31013 Transcript_14200/m.31013 type:complete len:150 (+) Transcript_14200:122-571(+)
MMNRTLSKTLCSPSFQRAVGATLARQQPAVSPLLREYHNSPRLAQHCDDIPVHEQQILIAHHLHNNNPHNLGSLSVRHPSTPFVLGWGEVESEMNEGIVEPNNSTEAWDLMNRNARRPKKANHGKRPCSRVSRREKRRRFGNWRRQPRS